MDVEFIALDKAVEKANWFKGFLEGIPWVTKLVSIICIHCDNMVVLTLAKNRIYNDKS